MTTTITKYKKAVRAAHKYNCPQEADEWSNPSGFKAAAKHEAKWESLLAKCEAIEEELTEDERDVAIEGLSENSLYGYMDEVC